MPTTAVLASFVFDYGLQMIWMAGLLACSAFFSGSETAFFQLPRKTVRQFAHSTLPIERLIAEILKDPNRFLTALLFGNMIVNVLFFAGSSILLLKIGHRYGPAAGTISGIICFMMLVLFGEILPKTLAYANTVRFCLWASPVCYIVLTSLKPILRALDWLVVQPSLRLFVRHQQTPSISINQLKILLESSRRQGLISNDENLLLTEILKFSFLKVRHVMLPRVEMPICSIASQTAAVRDEMIARRIDKMAVYATGVDDIVGMVHLCDTLLNSQQPLACLVRKVHFVPEQKTVESLIGFFKNTQTDHAVVVDEYGGVSGFVELEDIIEHLLGPMEELPEQNPIEAIGPLQYRLLADLAIYDWSEAFGINLDEGRLTTIGGFVTALLGKIPKTGDKIRFKNMTFTIEQVKNNRIQSVILNLEPLVNSDSMEAH
ncbi:MAG TPA: hemolysin family protein [Anaerohalosphaeraceae bacterium]|nr:HlyC/CorC family transporter [Phycisphaerae bacterium]HOK96015.1 hemolysin family protein [Anaerohalosphaeraceae bacterium]HOL31405.1 hemolysin family protein [Anaerohalosphaeraceae bacterium]HOM74969.1 hemolysin family protein [Anaerohalosphaeraceae bacterium]HPC63221.1 hemolysin family protein [Anaerohalosphaeraceae bacterium]